MELKLLKESKMTKLFKAGDIVECVELSPIHNLCIGKKYTVRYDEPDNDRGVVNIHGINGNVSIERFKLVEPIVEEQPEFDITADISRQYTRDGQKIDYIYDMGLDISRSLIFHIKGESMPTISIKNGKYLYLREHALDIVTRPALLPLMVTYQETYIYNATQTIQVISDLSIKSLKYMQDKTQYTHIQIEKVTYDPNTKTLTREIVYMEQQQ